MLDKFHKPEGSKGYSKCIEYGGKLVAPQEFEAIGGMKATKSWKRSLKHKCKPLLTYFNSGALNECDIFSTKENSTDSSVSQSINLAIRALESRLSSLQEVMVSSVGSLKASFETEIRSPHTKVSELTERIAKLEQGRPNCNIPASSMDTEQPSMESVIQSAVESILSEEKEKEKRKLNLILHRIPESISEDVMERKSHDTEKVNSVFQKYLEIDAQVDTVVRIGKKDPQKTRLLKIEVPSEKLKKQILRNSPKLRVESNPDWIKKVFITPDLTPKEQKENKALREKLVELNKSSPRSHRIKNGQIVRREDHLPST